MFLAVIFCCRISFAVGSDSVSGWAAVGLSVPSPTGSAFLKKCSGSVGG